MLRPISRSLFALPLALVALSATSFADVIFVPPGGDLVAAVAAAPDGSILELEGPGPYEGTLRWSGKALTLRAAAGVSPTIVGSDEDHAVDLTNSLAGTGAVFEGLRLVKGDTASPFGTARPAFLLGEGEGSPSLDVTFRDCELEGVFYNLNIGTAQVQVTFEHCSVSERAEFFTSWNATLDCVLSGCVFEAELHLIGREDSSTTATIEDCTIRGGALVGTNEQPSLQGTMRRCEVRYGLHVFSVSDTIGSVDFLAESCVVRRGELLDPPITATQVQGITTYADNAGLLARFVNATIAGFDVAYEAPTGTTAENLLFHDNVVDVAPGGSAAGIANSLIPDGTANGINGNIQAVAIVDGSLALVAGSPGIDAGNGFASGLGTLDFAGQARMQDGDGDGLAAVNLGALEGLSCAPLQAALEVPRAGLPVNPAALLPGVTTAPRSAATWDPVVDHGAFAPSATLDLLIVGSGSANVLLTAHGTLLVDPATIVLSQVVTAGAPFAVDVPAACDLVGATYHAQALAYGGGGAAQLTNALDLTIGVF